MISSTVLMPLIVHEYPLGHKKHEMHEKNGFFLSSKSTNEHKNIRLGSCFFVPFVDKKYGGWTGFFTPSETFQNTDRYSKPYGTGSKPVPAFVIAHTVAIELGQAS